MKIVILSGYYYPDIYPPAACIDKYVQEIKAKHKIDIICQKSSYVVPEYPDKSVRFHHVSNWWNDLRNYANWKLEKSRNHLIYKALLYFVRMYGLLISSFSYPTRLSWLITAYYNKLSEIYNADGIDVIISVSNPVCTHFASKRFKQIHSEIKWITYSTDPFTYYDTVYKNLLWGKKKRFKKNYNSEKDYYLKSDYNILTEELYNQVVVKFQIPEEKLICFPYVLQKINCSSNVNVTKTKKVILVYAGALNKVIRNPEFTLQIMSKISDVQLFLYQIGDCDSILNKYSDENIIVNSTVNRDEYINIIMNKADILLNIGNNSLLQAPSKMLELLSTGKPIINFYHHQDNQFLMIEKYPFGLNVGKEDFDAVDKVQKFCKEMKGKQMNFEEVERLFPENCLTNQLIKLENILNK